MSNSYFFPIVYLDFSKFSEMLMMEPAMSRMDGLKFKSKLTESDILKMRERVRNEFGRIHIILKTVSSYLLLVFRYFLFKTSFQMLCKNLNHPFFKIIVYNYLTFLKRILFYTKTGI